MSHLDPEQLALIALGEPVASPDEREHLSSCPVCAADVTELTHAAGVARSTMDDPRARGAARPRLGPHRRRAGACRRGRP